MACKTMLRQLISKWGIMSIDLQRALASDEEAVKGDLTPDYLEAPTDDAQPPELPGVDQATGEVVDQCGALPPELPADLFGEDADGQRALA